MNNTTMRTTKTRTRCPVAVLLCGLLMPVVTVAEGAVRVLSCEVVQQCNASGVCEPHKEQLEFRMEPKAQRSDGSGDFTLRRDDEEFPMTALSDAGPFVWNQQQDRYTLLVSSETQFLLHILSLDDTPHSTIQFMQCSFRQ